VSDAVLRTEGLVKHYGHTVALDGLDLHVDRGEVYGFLGPNGAGKTTTIRLLLDLIRPTEGRIDVLGLDPRAAGPDLRRRIGYLADDFVVDGRQTAGDLLTYLANVRGGVPASRIDGLSERLGLDPTKRIKSLSRGNRQKVGVVQAFMHEPELLILDEPTSGLDPFLQQEFARLVREAAHERCPLHGPRDNGAALRRPGRLRPLGVRSPRYRGLTELAHRQSSDDDWRGITRGGRPRRDGRSPP
jgi:ABC-2 type transport system ATP-binding protein